LINLFNYIIITIIAFGIWSSYTDIKYGKIKNYLVLLLFLCGFLINIFITKTFINFFYSSLINFLIAFILAFSMWLFNLWSQADAKLFSAFAFLLPITSYKQIYLGFPALTVLINTFVPFAIFYSIVSIAELKFNPLKKYLRENFNTVNLLKVIVYVLGISFITNLIFKEFSLGTNFLVQIFLTFVIIEFLFKYKKFYLDLIFYLFAIFNVVINHANLFTFNFIENYIILIFAYQILGILFSYLSEFSLVENVKINELRPGMILGEILIFDKKVFKKKKLMFISFSGFFNYIRRSKFNKVNFVLTDENIRKLKALDKRNKLGFETVKVEKSIPFAPILALGVVITYFLGTSIFAIF
jgi:Flp pilus assembly protein protease CpaA